MAALCFEGPLSMRPLLHILQCFCRLLAAALPPGRRLGEHRVHVMLLRGGLALAFSAGLRRRFLAAFLLLLLPVSLHDGCVRGSAQ